MRNKHIPAIAVSLFILMGMMAGAHSAEVAGITLPEEDDILVQMLLDDKIPIEERTELINETLMHLYPETLPAEERSRGLMRLVKRGDAPLELRYLAAAAMTEMGVAPSELGDYLVAECKRDGISGEWLSFCLRQLDAAYLRGDAEFKLGVVGVLTSAASRERGETAGTALLALWRIGEKDAAVKPALRTLNRAILSTRDGDAELMIVALEAASSMGDAEALPIARRLAYSDRYGVRLRLAAVNAILTLGDDGDAADVSRLLADRDIGNIVGNIVAAHSAQRRGSISREE